MNAADQLKVNTAFNTTGVALQTYKFFNGLYPTAAGLAYLTNSPNNPNDLGDAYYAQFSQDNRYINFAVNLATQGQGAALFNQNYGALTFAQAVAAAYDIVIGRGAASVAGINADAAIAYIVSQQAYFTALGGGDIGAKAAAIGYMMSAGATAHVGNYYTAAEPIIEAIVVPPTTPTNAGNVPGTASTGTPLPGTPLANNPSGVTLAAVGGTVVANTVNGTNTNLDVSATIVAGQLTGGTAVLKIGGVATGLTDNTILAGDTSVTFTTSDGTPTTGELQAAIAAGGVVTVEVTDGGFTYVSTVANPTLIVDYTAPTAPTAVTLAAVGGTVTANTVNNTNTHLTATATITAGEATGGTAVLKIGATTIATDNTIAGGDTTVTFTTSDGTPINAELQAAIAAGGVATVTLTDAAGNATVSAVANPTLIVDYTNPALAGAVTFNNVDVTAGPDATDTIVFTFDNPMNTASITTGQVSINNGHSLGGAGFTAVWSGGNTILTVTIGAGETAVTGDTVTLTGAADVAGNAANFTFLLP